MPVKTISAQCCIAGGGPAGMMLGLLLARAGVDTVVLEKHADFLRDFRGDTIHPSTLEVMHELGLLQAFLKLPHQEVARLGAAFGGKFLPFADMGLLPTRCKFIAFLPQWDFLNFIAAEAGRYPSFRLLMRAGAEGLIEEAGGVAGVRAETADGQLEVRAALTVGADGRHSTLRGLAGLKVREFGAPMDVLWFRVSRQAADPAESMGRFGVGHIFVLINRSDYWQCGFVIPKGTVATVRGRGLEAFREAVEDMAPFMRGRLGEIASWDAVKLLTVQVDRLERWHKPGLLFMGDAAHAMSPIGGVGINLAIQDAVAAANMLWRPLREGSLSERDLAAVQKRREFPTRATQGLQLAMQKRVITRVLGGGGEVGPPALMRLLAGLPILRWIPARLIGMGVRPEHVSSPARAAPR
jgi:2-polyprenyl-6-methoxyphenol hydroxylase-like FAD-dependent oxidoreductase